MVHRVRAAGVGAVISTNESVPERGGFVSGPPPDSRPPMAVAMQWVSRITSISLTMAIPAWAGYWADGKWKTTPWLTVVGAVLGFGAAMSQLLQLAKESASQKPPPGGHPR